VLNGIGGCTIEEAKERLTFAEAQSWAAYLRKRGSLHVGMRLEFGFALLASTINHALGGHATVLDYMPHAEDPEVQGTLADVMKLLSGKS